MEHLQREGFDQVMKSGQKLLLYFYQENDAASFLGMNTMQEIDRLQGRDFVIYLINTRQEPEIANAFSIKKIPEFITMKERKIHKRCDRLIPASQVLELLK